MFYHRFILFCALVLAGCTISIMLLTAQPLSAGYEVRYFSRDPAANGETDFKGETTVLDTEERIRLLKYYANEVSSYYGDKDLNTQVVTDQEIKEFLDELKPQPLPEVRQRLNLKQWKWMSYRAGQHEASIRRINKYAGAKDVMIIHGALNFREAAEWVQEFPVQTWRFSMAWKVRIPEDHQETIFSLINMGNSNEFIRLAILEGSFCHFTNGESKEVLKYHVGEWYTVKLEADLDGPDGNQYYNLYINDQRVAYYVPATSAVSQVNGFRIEGSAGIEVDDLYGVGYHQNNHIRYPYYPQTFMDENFDIKPSVDGWQTCTYDDTGWNLTTMPHAQGSERHAGEDLYFRKKVKIEDFKRVYLHIEMLDPGGEVWINGRLVSVVNDRYPVRVDLTKYLTPFAENLIALKVNHFYLNPMEGIPFWSSYLDFNLGWFAGRAYLDLVGETFINDAFLFTETIREGMAGMHAKIDLEHKGTLGFKGMVEVKMGVWEENSRKMQTVVEQPLLIGPGLKSFDMDFEVKDPQLWEPGSPVLYKVIIEVKDKYGTVIDDYVLTTGIRTLSQEGGTFRLNGKPAMLNGVQIMGFRSPIEHIVTWLRCPPDEWVAREMLMVEKMNCNTLRMHVHGWREKAVGVNDPRYCEMADQMGIMLIMCPPAWIRTADWGQIDFSGYHKYMKLVQNHPSIVMWEVSNHPNTFKQHESYESDLFSEEAYNAVYPYDPSRLISFTSHIGHMHYGNDEGTIDQGGDKLPSLENWTVTGDLGNQTALTGYGTKTVFTGDTIESASAWTAPMVTRGNQDAATGYGVEWSTLRKWPGAYRQGFLDSKERAYFNFEHQESIAQPNWTLCKGKPWYYLQSYEWDYDKGSIGRRLQHGEWRESQAWQAFSAYEAIKKLRMLDYDGFSWCCLHGGANAATYKKPVIDYMGHAKLAFHIHKAAFQPILAGSNNIDVVYGPGDNITPMVLNLGAGKNIKLTILVKDKYEGKIIDRKVYKNVHLEAGRTVTELESFKPGFTIEGLYFIEYLVEENE